jgi:hypothetical protein
VRDRRASAALVSFLAVFLGIVVGVQTRAAASVPSPSGAITHSYDHLPQLSLESQAPPSVAAAAQVTRPMSDPASGVGSCPEGPSCFAAEAGDASAGAARGGVYTLRDDAGNVVRTGRTNDLAAREVAHANDPVLGDFEFNPEYRTDVYAEQRGLEQSLYDQYPGAQAANGGYNFIRGIGLSNPNLPSYVQAAQDFLDALGGG